MTSAWTPWYARIPGRAAADIAKTIAATTTTRSVPAVLSRVCISMRFVIARRTLRARYRYTYLAVRYGVATDALPPRRCQIAVDVAIAARLIRTRVPPVVVTLERSIRVHIVNRILVWCEPRAFIFTMLSFRPPQCATRFLRRRPLYARSIKGQSACSPWISNFPCLRCIPGSNNGKKYYVQLFLS